MQESPNFFEEVTHRTLESVTRASNESSEIVITKKRSFANNFRRILGH